MRIEVFCSPTLRPGSAFRRWLSCVFGDIVFPLLAELLHRSFHYGLKHIEILYLFLWIDKGCFNCKCERGSEYCSVSIDHFGSYKELKRKLQYAESLQGFIRCLFSGLSTFFKTWKGYLWRMLRALNHDNCCHVHLKKAKK